MTIKKVHFQSNGLRIAGNLYYPRGTVALKKPFPAIVLGHPAAGVKEQAAGLYAGRMAEKGFITLAFDAAYQGESEGLPRNLEDPAQRVEDAKCAVSFLTTLKEVDSTRIGLLGICAFGGYGLTAAATDHRIKAIGVVSITDIARQFIRGGDGKQDPAVIQGMLDAAAADRTKEAKGSEPGVFPIFPENEGQAKAMGLHVFEGWEYYCTHRAQDPRSAKFFTWNSIDRIAAFDAFRIADMISPRPLLVIAGTKAATLWMGKEAFKMAREPKEMVLIKGATHVALYDKEEYVSQAIDKFDAFFKSNLG
jgi:hypothetical protein